MKATFLLFLALTSPVIYKQSTRPAAVKKAIRVNTARQAPEEYVRKAVAFIKQVKKRELAAGEFILVEKPVALTGNDCLQQLPIDKQIFSPAELAKLTAQAYSLKRNWKPADFPSVRLVMKDTVEAIFKVFTRHWTYFQKNIGRDFNEFSMPIFLRNSTYCLFYEANYCGGLCGGGRLSLYKREGEHWKIIKSYCEWIS